MLWGRFLSVLAITSQSLRENKEKIMKKKVAMMLSVLAMAVNLIACGVQTEEKDMKQKVEAAVDQAEVTTSNLVEGNFTIGISQFAEHGSLDNCKNGFLDGLAENGFIEGKNLTVLFDNAQADTGTASTIADNFVSQKADLICGIATPAAMSAYNSAMNTDIPVVFTAVSDPIAAGLAGEDGTPVGNVTGTSDYLAVTEQLQMIREVLPKAKKIGIIYTTSETNSESTIAEYKKYAGDYGFEIVEKGINTIADVELAAGDLVGKVDCLTNLTDNTVVSALQTELAAANAKNIPVFGSEVEQVKSGCVASMGLEYYELGKQTGAMAAKILKKEAKASEMKFETISKSSLYINTAATEKIELMLSDDFIKSAYKTFDEVTEE